MSPKPQALVLKACAADGYTPVSVDIYSGIYSYYFGGPIREIASLDILDQELTARDTVLVIKKKKWDAWTARPAGVVKIYEQWLAGQPYYVAVSRRDGEVPVLHNLPPAP